MSATTIQGTLTSALGLTPIVGSILVSWNSFTDASLQFHPGGSTLEAIGSDGSYDFQLAANLGATPQPSYYTAKYFVGNQQFSENWVVPVSGTALTIQQIRVTQTVPPMPFQVQVSQLYSATANIGDICIFDGVSFVPVTVQQVYPFSFSSVSVVSVPGATHAQGTALIVQVYDSLGNQLDPAINVDPFFGDVTLGFNSSSSGYGFIYGGFGRSLPNYSKHFTSQSAVTVRQNQHRFNTPNLSISVYDDDGNLIDEQATIQVTSTYDVNVSFASPTTFRVVILGAIGVTPSSGGSDQPSVPYLLSISNQRTVSILASVHGQGIYAIPFGFDADGNSVAVDYSRDSQGNLTLSFDPAFSGTVQVN